MSYNPKQNTAYARRKPKAKPQMPSAYHQVIKPMLAQVGTKADIKKPKKREEPKLDGTRIVVEKEYGEVRIWGARQWVNDYAPLYPEIVADVKQLPVDCGIWDGELTFFDNKTGKPVFINALSKRVKPDGTGWLGKYTPKAMIFDVLYIDSDDVEHLEFDDRSEIVKATIPKGLKWIEAVKTYSTEKEKEKYQEETVKEGLEGVMLKDAESPYRQNYRSPEWLKVKNWKNNECVVVGYTEGNNSRSKTFGALILAQKGKDGKWHYVGKTAGLKNKELVDVLQKLKKMHTNKPAVVNVPSVVQAKAWVDPKMVVQVKFLEKTPANGFLRMPDFLRVRDDKKPNQATMNQPDY